MDTDAGSMNSSNKLDRFILNRSAMNFDYAHYMLTEGGEEDKENPAVACSLSRKTYLKQLAEALNMNRTRILAFRDRPTTLVDPIPKEIFSFSIHQSKSAKSKRHIPKRKH